MSATKRPILDSTTYEYYTSVPTSVIEEMQDRIDHLEERMAYLETLLMEKTDEKP
jgi:hypothetical protein